MSIILRNRRVNNLTCNIFTVLLYLTVESSLLLETQQLDVRLTTQSPNR